MSGKPCSRTTSGAAESVGPASATWKRAPLAATKRCRQAPSCRTCVASTLTPLGSGVVRLRALERLDAALDRALGALRPTDLAEPALAHQRQDAGEHQQHDTDDEEGQPAGQTEGEQAVRGGE